jgi:hypothetical protein
MTARLKKCPESRAQGPEPRSGAAFARRIFLWERAWIANRRDLLIIYLRSLFASCS